MTDLEQAQFDIAKAIYIERIVNARKDGQSLSEGEVAREAISDANVFVQEWEKQNKAVSGSKVLMNHAIKR
jgi:DNA-binding transcriptional regulator YiaG